MEQKKNVMGGRSAITGDRIGAACFHRLVRFGSSSKREIGYETRTIRMIMQLVTTREATQLTGLSSVTLREWTSRRALIPADVPPKSQGSSARYSWQTILLLRLAATLRDRFHLELQAHRNLFAGLRYGLAHTSFIALWGKALVLQGGDRWSLLGDADPGALREDGVVVHLDVHLEALSRGFSLPRPSSAQGQLELFPAHPGDAPRHASAQTQVPPSIVTRRKLA